MCRVTEKDFIILFSFQVSKCLEFKGLSNESKVSYLVFPLLTDYDSDKLASKVQVVSDLEALAPAVPSF